MNNTYGINSFNITDARLKGQPTIKYWAQKTLPVVYDDSISYYENIEKLITAVNEMIERTNELTETIITMNKENMKLQIKLNNILEEIDERITNLEQQ